MPRFFLSILLLVLSNFAFSQKSDSLLVKDMKGKVPAEYKESKIDSRKPISSQAKAAMMSAVLPGLGQAYNKSYWKLPLVYGGAVGFGAWIKFNHDQYTEIRNELIAKTDGDPSTEVNPRFANASEATLRSVRDNTRRNRDYSIILATVFYGLQIAEAAVDAHLKDFDVSDDISFRLEPTLIPTVNQKFVFGLKATASF
ncbi:MAG: hypothetical protein ACI81T_003447 [Bacteroidia bacterium]|jgi:hypothetical protein